MFLQIYIIFLNVIDTLDVIIRRIGNILAKERCNVKNFLLKLLSEQIRILCDEYINESLNIHLTIWRFPLRVSIVSLKGKTCRDKREGGYQVLEET